MKRSIIFWAAAMVGLSLMGGVGCAADTSTPTVSNNGEALDYVNVHDIENQLFYIDSTVSDRPMTAEELGDTSNAIPVRIKFYDEFAIAWWAPDGEARMGVRGAMMSAFQIYNAQQISGEVNADGNGSVTTPTTPSTVNPLTPITHIPNLPAGVTIRTTLPAAVGRVWVSWARVFANNPNLIRMVARYHPGCI
ncbi:MAG: hypothetical protein IPK60_09675 [Sandaracinaceae bacterium]|jgi:hypothetical protein|nr:hypothetical protein [Sandaracinaceae bacterium]